MAKENQTNAAVGYKMIPTEKYEYNLFRDILKKLPLSQLEIIASDEKDLEIAKQMTTLINFFRGKDDNLSL